MKRPHDSDMHLVNVEGLSIGQIRAAKKYIAEQGLTFCKECDMPNMRGAECPSCWRQRIEDEKVEANRRFHQENVPIELLATPVEWIKDKRPQFYTTGHMSGKWPEANWPDVACALARDLNESDATTVMVDLLAGEMDGRAIRREGLGIRYKVIRTGDHFVVDSQTCLWVRIPGYAACD